MVVIESVEVTASAATLHAACCRQLFVASFQLFVSVFVYMYCSMFVPFRVAIFACAPSICGCAVLLFTIAPMTVVVRAARVLLLLAAMMAISGVAADASTVLLHADMLHTMMEVFSGGVSMCSLALLSVPLRVCCR